MENHDTSENQRVGDAIITRNVTLRIGVTVILDDVSFSTKYHGVTVLVGPSGCGKTMLLRSLVGLQRIDQGTITLLGMSVVGPDARSHTAGVISKERELNKIRSRVGLVFQHLFLWPYKSVLENIIEAPIAVRGESRQMAETHAIELLELVGLAHRAKALPRQLSGGEQQRVAVVRALAMKPELLLLDEITSALDPELVVDVLDLIRDLLKWNMTFLIVTHEMWFAQEVADQILFMDKGRILENSEPKAFFRSPSTARAREFLRRVHIISPKLE